VRYDPRRIFGAGDRYSDTGNALRRKLRLISASERKEEARAFLDQFCEESGASKTYKNKRWSEIRRELSAAKFYRHTPEELAYGARVSWRNHGRCIGRLFWESLEVTDCREVTDPQAMADQMTRHLKTALNGGRIQSKATVFKPVEGDLLPARIESTQITQFAGYRLEDGQVLGDRQNVEATRMALSMGWTPPEVPTRFDMLPFAIRDADDVRSIHTVPQDAVQLVSIAHPTFERLAELNLQWYAVPCVSNMIMTLGGIDYPCAPFNGFYMATEIASRNFADKERYDLLHEIAEAFGLDPRSDALWKDTTLTELNRAVSHSFKRDGVTMVDHHTGCRQFMEFYQKENALGRTVSGDWRWLVPPQASSSSDIFHLKMRNRHEVPNYYQSRSTDGQYLMPYYGNAYRSRTHQNYDRIMRRWKLWKRMPW
jgi:nitric-oxide synthase